MSSTNLCALSANFLRFVSSNRSSDDEMSLLAKDSRNYHGVKLASLSPRDAGRATYSLELVLPKLLFLGLVEEWEIPHMVYKDIAEEGQLRVLGRNLARIRAKRRTEAL
jgi:hypothetical protein